MPDRVIPTSELPTPDKVTQTCGLTVWADYETMKDLDLIAAYERMKRGPLMRMILVEKINTYKRNPAYKRFLVLLRAKSLQKKEEEE